MAKGFRYLTTIADKHNMTTPTENFYGNLQRAYDFLNTELFGGQLSPCLITLRSSDRVFGYHHKDRFISAEGDLLSELGLHPAFFTLRPVEFALSTLAHEMVHHWQSQFGNESHSNPHNKEWADKMEEVGLMPSSTGLPGGEKTGRHVTHYIMPGGPFDNACQKLVLGGFSFGWYDRHTPRKADERQAPVQALNEAGITLKLSEPPARTLPEPKLTDRDLDRLEEQAEKKGWDEPIKPPAVYAPPPRRENTRIKQHCPECKFTVWTGKEVKLICGTCSLPLRDWMQSQDEPELG